MDEALAALYHQRYHTFLRLAEAVVGDPETARDVVQDAFSRLIRSQSQFRGEGTLEGWVWRTIVNTARSTRRAQQSQQSDGNERLLSVEVEENHDDDVRSLLASLPERQRLVLFLRYYGDLDYRSIAEALGIESGTVAATLNQARATLRRMLTEVPQ